MVRFLAKMLLTGLLLLAAVGPLRAHAVQPGKNAAAALATRAAKAFEAGHMAEAEGLYREAFHIDKTEPAYLYGAARAAHAGRDLEHAERDYVAFLSLPNSDPARFRKAEKYLASLRAELAGQKAADARKAEDAGDELLACTLYLEAWRMTPDAPEPLLKAAVLERKRGDKPAAIGHLQTYLQVAATDAPGRATAETLLHGLGAKPVTPAPAQTTEAPTVAPAQAPTPADVDGWGPFGGSLGESAAWGPGSHTTARLSIPVSPLRPLAQFQHYFAVDVAASIVWSFGAAQDVIPRLGVNWFVRFYPNVIAYVRPHLDWHVAGFVTKATVRQDDGTYLQVVDRSNQGPGFGVDLGGMYKFGPLALIAELGTQHVGIAIGLGY